MNVPDLPGLPLPELLGRIADYTQDAIVITEAEPFSLPGPRIVYVNPAFSRLTGYAPEEVIGRTPRLLQGPGTSPATTAAISAALRQWQTFRGTVLNYRRDGTPFWIELLITPVADDAGWFRWWVAVQREADDQRRLDEQRRLFEQVLAQVDEGIVVADATQPDQPIEYVNEGFLRMTGYRPEDLLGRNCRLLQGDGADPETRTRLREGVARGEAVSVEILNRRRDGSPFWNHVTVAPLRNPDGQIVKFLGVQHDLTDTKVRERQLVAAQRLKAVGEMTGGIAHDFNNLLTAIGGAGELLAARLANDPEAAPLVQSILMATRQGTSQVRRLLAFSRTPLLARGVVDLPPLLQQAELLLRRSLRDEVALELALDPAARWVDAEAVQLEASLLNLVLNAQDAITGAGRIVIRTAQAERDGRPHVALSVHDDGCGMDDAVLAHVFEPFFTTKAAGRGSGLGLAMVRAFVSQLGGAVEVHSRPGAGATFTLWLPQAQAPTLATAEAPVHVPGQASDRARTSALRVLLVEDDEVVRLTARAMLESLGHTVHQAASGETALAWLNAGHGCDLLFTDLMMPGRLDGLALVHAARSLYPHLATLLTSGWADDAHAGAAERAEGSDGHHFLLKPYTLAGLKQAVAAAMTARSGNAAPITPA